MFPYYNQNAAPFFRPEPFDGITKDHVMERAQEKTSTSYQMNLSGLDSLKLLWLSE